MKTFLNYSIDHELKINYNVIKGEVNLETVIQHEQNRLSSSEFNEKYNTLVDIRGAKLLNFMEDIGKFVGFFDNKKDLINLNRKCALVTNTPSELVHATLFSLGMEKKDVKMKFKVFSTIEAAKNWLAEY